MSLSLTLEVRRRLLNQIQMLTHKICISSAVSRCSYHGSVHDHQAFESSHTDDLCLIKCVHVIIQMFCVSPLSILDRCSDNQSPFGTCTAASPHRFVSLFACPACRTTASIPLTTASHVGERWRHPRHAQNCPSVTIDGYALQYQPLTPPSCVLCTLTNLATL